MEDFTAKLKDGPVKNHLLNFIHSFRLFSNHWIKRRGNTHKKINEIGMRLCHMIDGFIAHEKIGNGNEKEYEDDIAKVILLYKELCRVTEKMVRHTKTI